MWLIHGKYDTKIYAIYHSIKDRCFNENNKRYYKYGGRGITMCDEWKNSFQAFYDWSMSHGYEEGLSIDRIDNDGNYEPSNCRWILLGLQQRNKGVQVNNKSGVAGVSYDSTRKRWRSYIKVNNTTISLGYYNDIDDAIKARKEAEIKYWQNQEPIPITEKSPHVGVSWNKSKNKWQSYIRVNGKRIHLGTFEKFEDAMKARADAEEKYLSNKGGNMNEKQTFRNDVSDASMGSSHR